MRAMSEYRTANRTWLATLTLSPTGVMRVLSQARVALAKGRTDFDALPPVQQFDELAKHGGQHVTWWLKRLRKNSGERLRYLAVVEAHKSGLPHWHILIHEMAGPIRYADLKDTWPLGFDAYKLVENPSAAGYVCKYLSKDMRARVRASLGYGSAEAEQLTAVSESET